MASRQADKQREKQIGKWLKKMAGGRRKFVSGDSLLAAADLAVARVPVAEARARNLTIQAGLQGQNMRKNQINLTGTRQRGLNANAAAVVSNAVATRHAQFKGAVAVAQKAQNVKEVKREYAVAKQNRVQQWQLNSADAKAETAQELEHLRRQYEAAMHALILKGQQRQEALKANARKNMATLKQQELIDVIGELERLKRTQQIGTERLSVLSRAQRIAGALRRRLLESEIRQKTAEVGLDQQQLKALADAVRVEKMVGQGEMQRGAFYRNAEASQEKKATKKLQHTKVFRPFARAVRKFGKVQKRQRFRGAYGALPLEARRLAAALSSRR